MNALPVITRELRVLARQPLTFRLRLLGVAVLLLVAVVFLFTYPQDANAGGMMFGLLHGTMFFALLLLVTFAAADCLSRERREDTLGLLMLTPLSPADIVIAKVLAQGVRAVLLMLAAIPVFALPMLLGGVDWQLISCSVALNVAASMVALGAALVASSLSRQWSRATVLALVLMLAGLLALTLVLTVLTFPLFAKRNTNYSFLGSLDFSWITTLAAMGSLRVRAFIGTTADWLPLFWELTLVALIWLMAAVAFAAQRTRSTWRGRDASPMARWAADTLTRPVLARDFFKSWLHRLLERNPVGWLERRAWQGRVVSWSWLAITLYLASTALVSAGDHQIRSLLQTGNWLLLASMAATAAGSFRRERETGVLELLLISPLNARRIVVGRLFGIWGQFFPAVVMLMLTQSYHASLYRESPVSAHTVWCLIEFAAVPVVGLYFSLRCGSYLAALLSTWSLILAGPGLIPALVSAWLYEFVPMEVLQLGINGLAFLFPMLAGAICFGATLNRLESRRFDFERVVL